MVNGSGVSRGDRNRNARLARLRELVPFDNAIVGIDLADNRAGVRIDVERRLRRWTRLCWRGRVGQRHSGHVRAAMLESDAGHRHARPLLAYAGDERIRSHPVRIRRGRMHDPLIALTYVAACTTRIKVGTGVFVLPLRNTLAVAKAAASLDLLSNGRFLFGVGIGWLAEEFAAVGMPFADRAARAREAIRLMRALWTEETPRFDGRFHQLPAVGFSPKPARAGGKENQRLGPSSR